MIINYYVTLVMPLCQLLTPGLIAPSLIKPHFRPPIGLWVVEFLPPEAGLGETCLSFRHRFGSLGIENRTTQPEA